MVLDLELLNQTRFKPEPISKQENEAIERLDKLDYAIYTRKLELACVESRDLLKRLGISAFIRAGDTAHSVYTAAGDLAIAEVGTYLHVICGIIPIKFVLKHYAHDPTVGLRDGDIFFCNEAIYGGIHNPDQIVFMPVFFNGEIIAWVSAAAHEPETGATEPGGAPNTAKSRYDEGLKVPPLKIGENFRLKTDLMELLENSVRYPLMISNDTSAKVAVCLRLRNRILEMVEKKGPTVLTGILRKIIQDTTEVVKQRIRKIPDGTFRQVAFLDTVGFSEGLVRLPVVMTKSGDKISFDLSHTSPQVPGPFNSFEHVVAATFASNIFQYFLNDIPASSGCLVPFEFTVTRGSCLNAELDAAISNDTHLVPVVVSAMQVLLAKALYTQSEYRKDEYTALPFGHAGGPIVITGKNQWSRSISNILIVIANSRAGGARLDKDGIDSGGFWHSGYAEASDCELDESHLPIFTLWRSYATDGGGPGKFRGGSGVSFGYVVRNSSEVEVTNRGKGTRFPFSSGIFGGYPTATRPVIIMHNAMESLKSNDLPLNDIELAEAFIHKGVLELLPNAYPTLKLREGDLIAKFSGGGGGYGDVLERNPEDVKKDVVRNIVSAWAARHVYKVLFHEGSKNVDLVATNNERELTRKKRLERGIPFAEFEKQWSQKKPDGVILKYYGKWPIAD